MIRSFSPRSAAAQRRRRRLVVAAAVVAPLALMPTGSASTAVGAESSSSPAAARPRLLVVGDSISAGYGLAADAGWVRLLEARLKAERYDYEVVNASVSGDTTAGGLARLPALLARTRPDVVVLELGGNDALRGLPLDASQKNLAAMVDRARAAGAKVLIVGMRIPPNYGRAYADRFAAMFRTTAAATKSALVPFFFEGFAERDDLFQPDRIHPTAEAQGRLLDNVWPGLQPLLGRR